MSTKLKMASTGVGFRWIDLLEKEFDKACVELDTSLAELEAEEPEVVFSSRQKIATLSSCFAQLTHKALTIFQHSAKLEAELVDMRAELVQARAAAVVNDAESWGGRADLAMESARARAEAAQLARENAALREALMATHSELFGARLATKYLDKELAGRIQQLQLLGRDMRSEVRDSLWAQVEAEILLQRHKTLVRVCRGLPPRPARPPRSPRASRPRTVRVQRSPHLGLGISVTGGREHGVPILISELEAGGPAALTRQLYVGDAILAINDLDLTQACHKEAVAALQSVKGDCALRVQFIATDDDDRLSEDNYRFPLYPDDGEDERGDDREMERGGEGATPTAPRTPDYNHRAPSATGSVSECESARYTEPYRAPAPAAYDYNSINNNLRILDMDDDTIKVETGRVEGISLDSPPSPVHLGPYRAVPRDSSLDSTPVHQRRVNKKKRKPHDWRTKGAYRPVADEQSSDDPESEEPTNSPIEIKETVISQSNLKVEAKSHNQQNLEAKKVIETLIDNPETHNLVETTPKKVPETDPAGVLPPPQPIPAPPTEKPKKAFRIGSARRVTNPPLTNGDAPRTKYPSHLLAGDGDPDFGTPV